MATTLYGRGAEQARLLALLAQVRGGVGAVLVLCGLGGVGRTAMLDWLAETADDFVSVRVNARPAMTAVPFGVLASIVAPLRKRVTPTVAAGVGPVLALDESVRPGTLVPACRELVRRAAADRPVLILVDDAHLADASSRSVLAALAADLADTRVAIVLTERDGAPPVCRDAERIALEGLAPDAAEALLDHQIPPGVAVDLARTACGNPKILLESIAAIEPGSGHGLVSFLSRRIQDRTDWGDPDPELAGLSDRARLALIIMALDRGVPTSVTMRAIQRAGIDGDEAIAELRGAGLLVPEGEPRVRHPQFAAAVLRAMSDDEHRAGNAALAASLFRDEDLERRAWHRAASCTQADDQVAGELERGARRAAERGAPMLAARAFARAAELTVDGPVKCLRRCEAARHFGDVGEVARADELLAAAYTEAGDQRLRATVLLTRLWVGRMRPDVGRHDEAMTEARRIESTEPQLAAALYAWSALPALARGDAHVAQAAADAAHALAEDELLKSIAEAFRAYLAVNRGEPWAVGALLNAAIDSRSLHGPGPAGGVRAVIALALARSGEANTAEQLATAVISDARSRREEPLLRTALMSRALARYRNGRWLLGYADARECATLSASPGTSGEFAWALATLGIIEANLGLRDAARRHARRAVEIAREHDVRAAEFDAMHVEAVAALVDFNMVACASFAAELETIATRIACTNPMVIPWRSDVVEALVACGRRDEAVRLADGLQHEATAVGSDLALGLAARALALVSSSVDAAYSSFETSLEHLRRCSAPLELARTLLCYGEFAASVGDRDGAVGMLDDSARQFTTLVAAPWLRRAERTFVRLGEDRDLAPVTGLDRLSPRELQIALAAATGATSSEIGARLFLSKRTIEHYLGTIYRKLGVSRRTELVRLLHPMIGDGE